MPLNLDVYVASELQRYKDTARCGELGAEVPGQRQQQLTQTLIVRLLKPHFLHRSLIVKSQQNRMELVTRTAIQLPKAHSFAHRRRVWGRFGRHHSVHLHRECSRLKAKTRRIPQKRWYSSDKGD